MHCPLIIGCLELKGKYLFVVLIALFFNECRMKNNNWLIRVERKLIICCAYRCNNLNWMIIFLSRVKI